MSRLVIPLDAQALEGRLQCLSVLAVGKVGVSMSSELEEHKVRANPSSSLQHTLIHFYQWIEIQQGEACIYDHAFGLMGSLW